MDIRPNLDPASEIPLYRQLASYIQDLVQTGRLSAGNRLPPTRDLATQLGLNRTTVSAAYELLESEGLINGQVGRGSFIASHPSSTTVHNSAQPAGLDWVRFFESSPPPPPRPPSFTDSGVISFAASRPAEELFPLDDFRSSAGTVLSSPDLSSILQLGSPGGHEPLRRYLLDNAKAEGVARPGDDILITNGCQQALDLLCRVLIRPGDTVAVEDPVYPGVRNVFQAAGANLAGVDPARLASFLLNRNVRAVILTPTFQNPTGETLSGKNREAVTEATRRAGAVLIENDIYSQLRYAGEPLPALKQLDPAGNTVTIRSFSKIAFPGLRVGWMIGPRPLISRLMDARQLADLHGDQFSQAVLLEFARSGRLDRHLAHMLETGRERLAALLAALEKYMPQGVTYTTPEGGMNLWLKLPGAIDTYDLLQYAHREGVAYIPGRHFTVSRPQNNALRLSFAGLKPEAITRGVERLARAIATEMETLDRNERQPVPALV